MGPSDVVQALSTKKNILGLIANKSKLKGNMFNEEAFRTGVNNLVKVQFFFKCAFRKPNPISITIIFKEVTRNILY